MLETTNSQNLHLTLIRRRAFFEKEIPWGDISQGIVAITAITVTVVLAMITVTVILAMITVAVILAMITVIVILAILTVAVIVAMIV